MSRTGLAGRRRLLAALALVLAWPAAVAADAQRLPAVADLDRLRDLSAPQISPDGEWVAYAVSEVDPDADLVRSDLWMTRWDGAETVRLTATPASEHTPRWRSDGRLGYLSPGPDGADQLWVIEPSSRRTEQLTVLPRGVSNFDWAPDGRRVVLVSPVVPEGVEEDSPGGPIVVDRMLFKRDGVGFLGKARSRLHLLDLDDGRVVQLTDGPFDEILPSFSPDGRSIAYVTKLGDDPDRHGNWDILRIAAEPGARPVRVSRNEVMDCDPVWGWNWQAPEWSADGSRIACIQTGDLRYSWFTLQQVVVFDAGGGAGEQPTAALDRNTMQPRFSADGRRIHFLLEDDQSVVLAAADTGGGGVERLTPPGRTVSAYDLGPDGRLAVLSSTPDTPPEISVLEAGELRTLTGVNAALREAVRWMPVEKVRWTAADGTELHGMLMKPPGFETGRRYPTVMRLHGGPVSQWQYAFDLTWQVLAARGYVVFGPNPRGSSGRGEAFQKVIFGDWGNVDVGDVLAGVDHLVASGLADGERLGLGGWSAGAMLTNYTIASDTRFKAATSGAGVSNMLAGWGTDEWWQDWEAELGLPWQSPEHWLRVSYPFLHADRIRTPTLFLCGAEDFNVPLIHSEQMYMALKRLGVPTRLVIYPGQSHGIARPSFRRDVLERYLDWYRRWLQ